MPEGDIATELIRPTLSEKLVKDVFEKILDNDPRRKRVFKIRSRTHFYRSSDDEDNNGHVGTLVEKVEEGQRIGIKPKTENDYYLFMAEGEFEKLYGKNPEKVQVKNVGRAVSFVPDIEPLYLRKPSSQTIVKSETDDLFYAFLNPTAVSWVDPKDLPAYNPSVTKAN